MFKRIAASNISLTRRSTAQNIGTNDAWYTISNNGDTCPYYTAWVGMLRRCYNIKDLQRRPTYKDCKVADEWHIFSNFLTWAETQGDITDKCLDKDILGAGIYSKETCCFIDRDLNNLLCSRKLHRGKYPQGVYYATDRGKYIAQISKSSKRYRLGSFNTVAEAESTYIEAKIECIMDSVNGLPEHTQEGLVLHADRLLDRLNEIKDGYKK